MKKKWTRYFKILKRLPVSSAVLVCLFLFQSAFARDVVDSTGTHVAVTDRPARIITLIPSLGELAADFLADNQDAIVGVSEFTDYPPLLAKVDSIGPYTRVNLEKIVTLKPDLVLATKDGNSKDQIERLRELKVPVVVVSTATLKEVVQSVQTVGLALGMEAEGKRMATQLQTGMDKICHAQGREIKPRVMMQLGDQPLVAVGKGTFLNEALHCVGGENVYETSTIPYPRPSIEDIVQRDPDIILVMTFGHDGALFRAMARKWKDFPKMKAVQEKRVYVLSGDTILRPTVRLLEGLSLLQKAVQRMPKAKPS